MYYGYPYMPFQAQPIQQMQRSPEIGSRCFFVGSMEDMKNIQAELNVVNIGINKNTKEIYTKQLRNDGLVDSFVYKVDVPDTKEILEKLALIEKRLDQYVNTSGNSGTADAGNVCQPPGNAAVQSDDAGQKSAATNANPA